MSKKSNASNPCVCEFVNLQRFQHIPKKADFQRWVNAVFRALKLSKKTSLCIIFLNLKESEALNKQYRKKSGPTNVLSFPYSHTLGDLALCVPVIKQEANVQGKTMRAHIAHLVVHGTLHLLGYDHQKNNDAKKMEWLERRILKTLRFKDPYQ